MFTIKVVEAFSERTLKDILKVYFAGMPWHFANAEDYFREMLAAADNINILSYDDDDNKPVAYLLGKPQDLAAQDKELTNADPEFKSDPERFYIETMEMIPEVQKSLAGGKLYMRMSYAMLEEVLKRGKIKFSMHARIDTGLSKAFRRHWGRMVTDSRVIEKWPFYGYKEATEYLEAEYKKH